MTTPPRARRIVDDPIEWDRNGLEMLDRDACLGRLRSAPIGRLGLCMGALPVVLPVNFVVADPPAGDEPVIVVRSVAGSKQTAALDRAVVALEIDGYDPIAHTGWSVLVQGLTRVITDPDELDWAASLPLEPWAVTDADTFIVLDTDVVRGRRFGSR